MINEFLLIIKLNYYLLDNTTGDLYGFNYETSE